MLNSVLPLTSTVKPEVLGAVYLGSTRNIGLEVFMGGCPPWDTAEGGLAGESPNVDTPVIKT